MAGCYLDGSRTVGSNMGGGITGEDNWGGGVGSCMVGIFLGRSWGEEGRLGLNAFHSFYYFYWFCVCLIQFTSDRYCF